MCLYTLHRRIDSTLNITLQYNPKCTPTKVVKVKIKSIQYVEEPLQRQFLWKHRIASHRIRYHKHTQVRWPGCCCPGRRDLTYIQRQEMRMRKEQQPASRLFSARSSRLQSATANCSESDAPQAEASSRDGARRDPPASAKQPDSSDSSGPNCTGSSSRSKYCGSNCPIHPGKLAGQSPSTQHTVLRCCTVNLNGICNKMCSLTRLIKEQDLKIICVTESHLTSFIPNSNVSTPHFQLFRKDVLGDVEKHGVCVYVYDTLMVDGVSDISENALMFRLANYNVHFLVIYILQASFKWCSKKSWACWLHTD